MWSIRIKRIFIHNRIIVFKFGNFKILRHYGSKGTKVKKNTYKNMSGYHIKQNFYQNMNIVLSFGNVNIFGDHDPEKI